MAEIAGSPALLAEAQAALPALRTVATTPAGTGGVRRVIGRRQATYPAPDLSEAALAAWWADYFDACGDLPECALEAAMRAWVRSPDAEFMPKPGRLRALANATPSRTILAYERARLAISAPPPRVIDPIESAARKAMVSDVLASLGARS